MRRMVSLGTLSPGAPVPSVRELALRLRVNPNTVSRAYQRLCDAGIFIVRRGEGTFVADRPARLDPDERMTALRAAAIRYLNAALAIGADPEEAIESVRVEFDRVLSPTTGGVNE